jgi:hypothetical protein
MTATATNSPSDKTMTTHVYFIGYPSEVGGANTECWHWLKLMRRFGMTVTVVPTWRGNEEWDKRIREIGCKILVPTDRTFPVPDDSVCVSFCNAHFESKAHQLQARDCRIIYVPCMSYLNGTLVNHHEKYGPFDHYVFQSKSQQNWLCGPLSEFGVKPGQCHVIHGAFDWTEFEYRPRRSWPGKEFVVGRLSRPDAFKFSFRTWELFGKIRQEIPGLRVRIMGWHDRVAEHVGEPPEWAEVMPAKTEPAGEFLQSLHCMCQVGGDAWDEARSTENWPRVGLEAMAAGVPIVAEKRGGWPEMIEHGETGMLGHTIDEIAACVVQAGQDGALRAKVIRQAHDALRTSLAEPGGLWAGWKRVFEEVG